MQPRLTRSPLVRGIALLALALIVGVFCWWPAIDAFPATQGGDGPFFHKMIEAARISVVRYHEWPLWNPYECGGVPLWDNPQAPFASPLMWPLYVLGTTKTMLVWYVVHTALGFASMWWLVRLELRLSRISAFVCAATWAFCGFFQNHLPGGHFVFTPFYYFPLGILFWRRAEKDFRFAIALGLLVAEMIFEGGVYPVPHLAVILGVETLTRVWPIRRLSRIALAGVIVLAVALSVGAVRFLPVIDQVRSHTRGVAAEDDALKWDNFKLIFLTRTHERFFPGQRYVFGEYGMYLGPFIVALALVGIALGGVEVVWLVVILAVSVALMIGDAGKLAPWTFLRAHVFPFKDMRVPSRFGLEASLALIAFAGLAIDRIGQRARKLVRGADLRDAMRTAIVGLALVGAGDVLATGIGIVSNEWKGTPEDTRIAVSPHLYIGSRAPNLIDGPRENLARLACWEEWGFGQGAPLWEGDVPQARAADEGATVTNVVRTQNAFTADVDAHQPTRILFDTTWDDGWHASTGNVVNHDKELAVDVPAGKFQMRVWYRPKKFTLGLWLTVIGSIGSVAALVWLTRRRRVPPAEAGGTEK